jgi:hypothetical protein
MKAYRIIIEGVFVTLPGDKSKYGFFLTLHIEAKSAADAIKYAHGMLRSRLINSHVGECSGGICATHYLVGDIWEIDPSAHKKFPDGDGGFIFHPLRGSDKITAIIRNGWIRVFKPHLLLSEVMQVGEKSS